MPSPLAAFSVLCLTIILFPQPSHATSCGYSRVEIRGRVETFGGEGLKDASIIAFADFDRDSVADYPSLRDVWRTDASGHFLVSGRFYDYAWPRWWHRFSSELGFCGRDPDSFTIVVLAENFSVQRVTARRQDGAIEKLSRGNYVVTLREPIRLMPVPSNHSLQRTRP
jgi:hypothetical protein